MNRAKCLLVVFVILFVIGCAPAEETVDEETISGEESAAEEVSDCVEGWKCTEDDYKAYQNTDCSWKDAVKCDAGCENGECKKPPVKTCQTGWKCIDENRKGYQLENCKYEVKVDCDWKCENSECVEKPENYTEPVDEPTTSYIEENLEEEEVESAIIEIHVGETHTVNDHELSIYFIDVDRVKIQVDNDKSDWLYEGDTYQYQETTINIEYVVLQPYAGGIQMAGYTYS